MILELLQNNSKDIVNTIGLAVHISSTNSIHFIDIDISSLYTPSVNITEFISYCYNKMYVSGISSYIYTNDLQFRSIPLPAHIDYNTVYKHIHQHIFVPRIGINTTYYLYNIIYAVLMQLLALKSFILYVICIIMLYLVLGINIINILLLLFILILYLKSHITNIFLFIMLIFLIIGSVQCQFIPIGMENIITFSLYTGGSLLYGGVNMSFDYFVYRSQVLHDPIISNWYLNHVVEGILYLLAIVIGVFSSNSFWLNTSVYDYKPLWFVISSLISVISSTFWNRTQLLMLNSNSVNQKYLISSDTYFWSVIRSFFEMISFTAISWSTYYSWGLLVQINEPYFNLIAAILGFIFHVFFSYFVIKMEHTGTGGLLYGLFYLLSFSFGAFSTNGLFAIITSHIDNSWSYILALLISSIFSVILHPNVYRIGVAIDRFGIIKYVIVNYVLMVNFVSASGLLFYWFN